MAKIEIDVIIITLPGPLEADRQTLEEITQERADLRWTLRAMAPRSISDVRSGRCEMLLTFARKVRSG